MFLKLLKRLLRVQFASILNLVKILLIFGDSTLLWYSLLCVTVHFCRGCNGGCRIFFKGNQKAAYWSIESKYSKLKRHYKYNQSGQLRCVVKYKGRKMAKSRLKLYCCCPLLLAQTNSCLFTNKGHFSSPLWVLIGLLAKFHE